MVVRMHVPCMLMACMLRSMVVSCMCGVVMPKIACCQGCDEKSQSDEHCDAFAAEMSGLLECISLLMMMVTVVMYLVTLAVCLDSALFMVMFLT